MNDLIIIPLKSKTYPGRFAIIDAADADLVCKYNWSLRRQNYDGRQYVCRWVRISPGRKRKMIQLHRFIMDAPKGLDVDHKNNDGLDCRRSNMRLATRTQNLRNRRTKPTENAPYKGVYRYQPQAPWSAHIFIARKRIGLGRFDTPEEAARAYDAAAIRYFGEFACLNFPDEQSPSPPPSDAATAPE